VCKSCRGYRECVIFNGGFLAFRPPIRLLCQFAGPASAQSPELNRGLLRQRVQTVPLVAAAAFVVPMLLGAGSTVAFADWYAATGPPEVSPATGGARPRAG
jgi:hypothetical protein